MKLEDITEIKEKSSGPILCPKCKDELWHVEDIEVDSKGYATDAEFTIYACLQCYHTFRSKIVRRDSVTKEIVRCQ